jgi:DNA adenine methylase
MRYFGGKAKIAKELSLFLNTELKQDQTFVDLFCGSCNVVSKVQAKRRLANDLHKELVSLHKAVQQGQELPKELSAEMYLSIKNNKLNYPEYLVAFAGFGLSYSGKYFGGYARCSRGDDYCGNARNSLLRKHQTLVDVEFSCGDYSSLSIPWGSLVYCDIPYKNTTKYSTGAFDHEKFYEYAKEKTSEGCRVLVSEYEHNVPEGWSVVWRHESKKDIRNKHGVQEKTVEVVMCLL